MRERSNTHYCFHCGGHHGFLPDKDGNATNSADGDYDPMARHDPVTHAEAVVGGADKHVNVWDWLKAAEYPPNFPYVVSIPSI
jgi:hypothetical protein